MTLYDSKTYIADVQSTLGAREKELLSGKTVMITGAGGLIGSFLADVMLDASARVIAVGRSEKRLRSRFGDRARLTVTEHDVVRPVTLACKPDFIVHAASNAYPAAFKSDPVGTMLANVEGTKNMLDLARGCGARLLFISSGEVYGQGDGRDFTEDYSGFIDPTDPRSCYPSSKRAAETLCVSYAAQYGVDAVIARPCHVYGPSATDKDDRVGTQFVALAHRGEPIVLKSRGAQLRSYMYVADCASALTFVMFYGRTAAAYNVANENARATIAEFAKIAADAAGVPLVYDIPDGAKDTGITRAVLDNSRLCALGWTGRFTVPDGVARDLAVLKEMD